MSRPATMKNRQPPRWRFYAPRVYTLFNAIRRDVSSFGSCMPTHLVWFGRDAVYRITLRWPPLLPRYIRAGAGALFPPRPVAGS
ncbi:hypothetical protein KCP76_17705 [Salmonella enterica subsp. enterica serovar Weltevreden]|nr:hypothetical protein KCP76_17705 [Salmonella enterica subsp. enterica serovar Weltevreden]